MRNRNLGMFDDVIVVEERDPLDHDGSRPRRQEPRKEVAARGSRLWLIVPGAALLTVLWFAFSTLYTEYLWFSSVGFQSVFTTTLTAGALAALVAGALAGVLTYLNLRLAVGNSSTTGGGRAVAEDNDEEVHPLRRRLQQRSAPQSFRWIPLPAAVVTGMVAALAGWGSAGTILRYLYQVPFAAADPVFGRDIAYYVFTSPLLQVLSLFLLALLVVNLIGAFVVHFAHTKIELGKAPGGPDKVEFPRAGRTHLLALAGALFLLIAWQTYLAMPLLLTSNEGAFFGAGYSEINSVLPLLWAQMAASVLAAFAAFLSIFRRNVRVLGAAASLLVLTALAGYVYPAFVQRFSVAPNELAKETPFIRHNIEATRTAFGLNGVDEREISGGQILTADDINANRRTVNNIRLWDRQPLLDTFGQIQEIRTYYEFRSVDNDRYRIGGEMRHVMLSPRELNAESLPNRNWINEHLTFTHGYGATVGPVDKVTPEGLPELFVRDLPPASNVPELKIDRPEIYFGEASNDRVYVNTRTEEFSHPAGEQNVFRNYSGADGLPIGSFFEQVMFATRFGDLKLLLSEELKAESRVLMNRNIRQRLEAVAPYLRFDRDPYMVISEGKLIWIADAYTVSDRYPYSQPVEGVNYIRNSVKATVDAYDGTINLYVADAADPIIQTYERIFPGTLKPLAEMPANLRPHLRYPEDKFRLQARVFADYHMDEPQEFYNREDRWTIAQIPGASPKDEARTMEPYYTIMKLPGEQREEFIMMLPFTPQRKDNLAAWMVARADGENYGRLAAYRFPKQQLVFGPKQIIARINQDPEISRQLTLWNQRGTAPMFGTMMVIPIEESLIYVQPLYLRAEAGKIPELRRVIVAHENRIAMEETLEKSLARLFGDEVNPSAADQPGSVSNGGPAAAPPPPGGLLEQAREHYRLALEAQRAGDWAKYGDEVKRLGDVLEQLSDGK